MKYDVIIIQNAFNVLTFEIVNSSPIKTAVMTVTTGPRQLNTKAKLNDVASLIPIFWIDFFSFFRKAKRIIETAVKKKQLNSIFKF